MECWTKQKKLFSNPFFHYSIIPMGLVHRSKFIVHRYNRGTREVDENEENISSDLFCVGAISFVLHPSSLLHNRSRGTERNPEPI